MIGRKIMFKLYSTNSAAQYIGIVLDKYRAVDQNGNVIDKYLVSVEDILFEDENKQLEKGSVTSLQPSSISEVLSA